MAHSIKRPYAGTRSTAQASITSYFSSPSSTPEVGSERSIFDLSVISSGPNTSNLPPLPYAIQSNLLNVGMRVRKSVPEGYKTGSSYSAFSLFSDTPPSPSPTSSTAPYTPPTTFKTRPRSGNRELTPFCGILNVGGLGWGADGDSSGEDEVPFLSSQGSTISSSSVDDAGIVSGGNKRRFLEDDEQDSGVVMGGVARGLGERALAVPRRKKWAGKGSGHAQMRIFGQENFGVGGANAGGMGNGQDMDFEDAEFLDYGLDREVEMGGCN